MSVSKAKVAPTKIQVKPLSDRAQRRIELEKKRRETELKKMAKVVKKTVECLERKSDYVIYHKANDHLVIFKKLNFTVKKELPDNELRFQPREWHESKEMWTVFVATFITGAKVDKKLSGMKIVSIKSEDSIDRVLHAVGD